MFVDDWGGLVRGLIVGGCAYLSVVVLLRGPGKRMLAKLNAFDFVVTIALGSTLAAVMLSSDVAPVEGVLAMAPLVALQFLVAWLAVRSRTVEGVVESAPARVRRDGFLRGPMKGVGVPTTRYGRRVRREGQVSTGFRRSCSRQRIR